MIHDEIGVSAADPQWAMASINLDAAANTRPAQRVIDAIVDALESEAGNPASAHQFGEVGRLILSRARDSVTQLVSGAFEDGVIFTSGCTEANNTVIQRAAHKRIVTSRIEHPSVLRAAEYAASQGADLEMIDVDADGLVDLCAFQRAIEASDAPLLVSVQAANSETGVIQPIAAIAAMLASHPAATFHSDAAQAFGKIAIDMARGRGPDIITLSGHKLHGPMGVGAIILADREVALAPLLLGGEQEQGRRAGTEAVSLIAGLGAACEMRFEALERDLAALAALRDRFETGLRAGCGDLVIQSERVARLPNISNIRFLGVDAMALIAQLDSHGIAASQGSACSSQRPEPSHVLTAMGLAEADAFETVRFSLSVLNSSAEIDLAVQIIGQCVHQLRSSSWRLR